MRTASSANGLSRHSSMKTFATKMHSDLRGSEESHVGAKLRKFSKKLNPNMAYVDKCILDFYSNTSSRRNLRAGQLQD